MLSKRSSVLLHPASLPGTYRIGIRGKEAFHFIDFLSKADQQLGHIFPLYVAYDSKDVWMKSWPILKKIMEEGQ